jgi:uncharacterized membrane protein YccF (DUF307 family)
MVKEVIKAQETVVRSVLKSEITWLIFVIVTIMGFVTSVVMPLQKVQLDIANISLQISENKIIYERIETRLNKVELDHASMLNQSKGRY